MKAEIASNPSPKPLERTSGSVFVRPDRGKRWWTDTVVYQIYPRSFKDSNGDGIGDLPGIVEKLDYLQSLGVGTLWLSPVFASPNDDNGYDISDYDAIHPDFGTMDDFKRLLKEAHARGLRVILDLVVNHTSDEHPWFVESRSSRDNPKRGFYHWHPGKNGGPPNNWESYFKGSAWEKDDRTGEYYLHLFSRKQPDLNWTNPELRQEIYQMMHRWLGLGVDGFRLDVINFLAKAPGWPDAPAGTEAKLAFGGDLYANQPGIHGYLQEMHAQVLRHYDVVAVGECHFIHPDSALEYVAGPRPELDLVFLFDAVYEKERQAILDHVDRWHSRFNGKAITTFTLNNHDTPRLVSKFGDDGAHRERSAKLFATLILTVPGVPFLFQGEELGMTNVAFENIGDYRDIEMINRYRALIEEGLTEEEAMERLRPACRDNARTPMHWEPASGAGFTTGTPWIGLNPNHTVINAAEQGARPDSVLNYYRRLLALRQQSVALREGNYVRLPASSPSIFLYQRHAGSDCYTVVLNVSGEEVRFTPLKSPGELILCNVTETRTADSASFLAPWEARIYRPASPELY